MDIWKQEPVDPFRQGATDDILLYSFARFYLAKAIWQQNFLGGENWLNGPHQTKSFWNCLVNFCACYSDYKPNIRNRWRK